MRNKFFYRKQSDLLPERPPPIATSGILGWIRKNLFSSSINSILTVLCIYLIYLVINDFINWAYIDASFEGNDRLACTNQGACWAWVDQRIGQFFYGFYP
ncbi:MAG: Inner membrane amino-acid ABC transporter permease protein YhdY, partial [Alphaproteobacteria bacterium MarineAlpha2_Bin1]